MVKEERPIKRLAVFTNKQIAFKDHAFFKKEIIGDKTMYHTRLMNVLKLFKPQADKFLIYLVNSLNKEEKCVYLFPIIKDGDAFLGMFYGFRKIKYDRFYNDYTSVCKFPKKIFKTFNKICYIEFRFKTGSVFLYIHTIVYLITNPNVRFSRKLCNKILDLEKEVFKFYGRDLDPEGEGIITKWIAKINQEKLEKMENPSLLRSLLRSRLR
ncbi:DUF226 domain-containing protein [Borreliella burgdorferi]|uniref:DUF226 domain-containing protein n=1 Tax=Borreliella burgdorferi TaxID=139 RepID=UPI003DA5E11D